MIESFTYLSLLFINCILCGLSSSIPVWITRKEEKKEMSDSEDSDFSDNQSAGSSEAEEAEEVEENEVRQTAPPSMCLS